MSRPVSKHPTELELEILKVLWRIGPATVRQVQSELAAERELAYTSVMTMMTIMARKGYAKRTKEGRSFVYRAAYQETRATKSMLQDLIDRLFGGSTTAVMQHLLEASELDEDELKQIRSLINRKVREKNE